MIAPKIKRVMEVAIRTENLKVRYRSKKGTWLTAVNNLSMSVQPGEVVGFLGPNGAGKSSTIKALMGFVQPTSGKCEIFGHEAGSLDAKRRVGYLPEVALYYPYLTPQETLTLYGELQGLSGKSLRTEVSDLLEAVGIAHASKKQNRTLSKGMTQRVGIAQALLGNPDLLILDEVTSGLDPVGRRELRLLMKDRQSKGATLFFSSHELSEVDMLCDRIILIDHGDVVQERNMKDLKSELRHFSIVYSGSASLIGLTEDWSEAEPGVFRASFETKEQLLEALERIRKAKGQILDVLAQEGSLEDYFVKTIARAA